MAILKAETSAYPNISKPGYAQVAGAANHKAKVSILTRLIRGMTDHFHLRATSWIMSATILSFGLIITHNPGVLTASPESASHYVYMLRGASLFKPIEDNSALLCGYFCLTIGVFRLLSLALNGTFPSFIWSSHIRALGSFLACFVWFQILLGVYFTHEWVLAVPAYLAFLSLDTFNLYIAAVEINPKAK